MHYLQRVAWYTSLTYFYCVCMYSERKYMAAAAYEPFNFPAAKDYSDRNWHELEMRKPWATNHANNFQIYMSRTTNRIESIKQKLKPVITTYAALHTFLKETMQYAVRHEITEQLITFNTNRYDPLTKRKLISYIVHCSPISLTSSSDTKNPEQAVYSSRLKPMMDLWFWNRINHRQLDT